MKNKRLKIVSLIAVLSAFISLSIVGGASARSFAGAITTQTPMPTPTTSPTPIATPTVVPTPVRIQTIDELQSKIRMRIFSPDVRRGRVGIRITSLNSGKVIFENDADKYFMPASNMKNFTVAAAMERLGPDFRFVTSVYANAKPDASGTIKGDLRIFGRGDISISTAFNPLEPSDEDPVTHKVDPKKIYYKGIDKLVDKIAAAGVRRIEGGIVGDESYFKGFAIPGTWEWDDLQPYYGAEISALPLNDNAVDLAVTPGNVGGSCVVTISPVNALMRVVNLCTTNATAKHDLRVAKQLDRNVLEITGSMSTGEKAFNESIAFTHPADLFMTLLKQRLELKGVIVTGSSQTLPANLKSDAAQIEIAKLESPPFSVIAQKTMKPSQNMYTETILWTLGEQIGRKQGGSGESSQLGLGVVKNFLKQIGAADDGILQYDGSGLSRHDLITPSAVVTLYTYMAKQSKYSQAWRDSLSIGGIDGTLRNRFKGTAAAGNFRGKTGTIDQVSALSGYMTTAGGEQLVISIIVNDVADTHTRTALIDDIVLQLAKFNGKVE